MPLLGVNIDHVATLRQARRGDEPDPFPAAHEAALGGAAIITVHLREDRRHIHDRDLERLVRDAPLRLNLEMGATDEMVGIALRHRAESGGARGPHMCTLVPEGRAEITTEGGLDVAGQLARMTAVVSTLKAAPGGIVVSAFIDADPRQVEAAAKAGFDACEIHTGPYAKSFARAGGDLRLANLRTEFERVQSAGHLVRAVGMRFNAGHALNYVNVAPIAALPGIEELHIGHAIISRAVFVGLRTAVRDMVNLLERP
ncbi:MAG: pyridoxine 5'-phosphate synthase [Phycisphaerales bacterium]